MKIIENGNLRILKADENKLIKCINDNGKILEDGTSIPPYLTDTIYLGKQITTIEQAQELYEEIEREEENERSVD